MRKPEMLRVIYAELRRNVSSDVPDGDLLRLAHLIVQAQADPSKPDIFAEFGVEHERFSLFTAPVDHAMSDGGWRVMEYERRSATNRDNNDADEAGALRALIEKFLGPEWQHHQWIRPLSAQ